MDGDGVLDHVVGIVIGPTIADAWLDAATSEPDREAAGVMIATVVRLGQRALAVDGPSEFSSPEDQRLIEHAALTKILDQGGLCLIDRLALGSNLTR